MMEVKKEDIFRQLIISSFDHVEKYWHECLVNGFITTEDNTYKFGSIISKDEFYESSGLSNKYIHPIRFWKKIRCMSGPFSEVRQCISKTKYACIILPDLQRARNSFKSYVGDPNWEFPDIEY